MQPVNRYFVTGATGVVGSAVVGHLLHHCDSRIYILARAADTSALKVRMEELFNFWDIADTDQDKRNRVTAFAGDVTLPRFGLEGAVFDQLARDCSHIIHAAGNVRMNLELETARKNAQDSARQIVELALACKSNHVLEKVEIVSTVGVGGRLSYVEEQWLTEDRSFHNTYEQAKAEAETYLRQEMETHSLPITVHRPSMVVGNSESGRVIHYQVFYHLSEFLSGRKTWGIVPRIEGTKLDIIPSDYVASAIVASSQSPELIGQIVHLCSGPKAAIDIAWLTERVQEAFRSNAVPLPALRLVPLAAFKLFLPVLTYLAPGKLKKAVRNLSIFLDYATDRQIFENEYSNQLLLSKGIQVPAPERYLTNILNSYLQDKKKQGP